MTVSIRVAAGSGFLLAMVADRLKQLGDNLANRRQPLINAVQTVAFDWSVNFASEGGNVGGWHALSERAIRERAEEGYASGPILRRSGTVYDTAIAPFAIATRGFSTSNVIPYRSGSAAEVWSSLSLQNGSAEMPGVATLQAGGYAVTVNNDGSNRVPARPMWYVDDGLSGQVRQCVETWVSELAKEF